MRPARAGARRSRRGGALALLLAGAGLAVLALAFLTASTPPPPYQANAEALGHDGFSAASASVVRAGLDGPAAAPAAVPPAREPPPVAVLPASQARALNSAALAVAGATAGGDEGPFIVRLLPAGPDSEGPVSRLAEALTAAGMLVPSAAEDAYLHPDVILALGHRQGASAEVWHCQSGPAASSALAAALKAALSAAPPPVPADGAEPSAPESSFPCEELHAGRAQVGAALVELPPSAQTGSGREDAVAAITAALGRFFQENGAALRRARRAVPLVWPARGPITSYFGPGHPLGIDIGQWEGDVVAAAAGVVVWAGGERCCGYGLFVVVESPGGITTLYSHLDSLAVKQGQRVRQGQVVGRVGCTGHCSGTHLHFEVIVGGERRDPLRYLP